MAAVTFHIPSFTAADRLRKAREDAGLTQRQLAERIGITKNTISNYESGRTTRYGALVLKAWSEQTGVPIEWLRWGVEPTSPGAADDPTTSTINDIGCFADADVRPITYRPAKRTRRPASGTKRRTA